MWALVYYINIKFEARICEHYKNLKKKDSQKGNNFFGGRACFGWVGRSTANHHFLKIGLTHLRKSVFSLAFGFSNIA